MKSATPVSLQRGKTRPSETSNALLGHYLNLARRVVAVTCVPVAKKGFCCKIAIALIDRAGGVLSAMACLQ